MRLIGVHCEIKNSTIDYWNVREFLFFNLSVYTCSYEQTCERIYECIDKIARY